MSLLKLYHSLPYSLRCVAAGARGAYLRAWRYGHGSDRLVREAHERESWSHAQWQQWREARLAFFLKRAVTRVPYYRDRWAKRDHLRGSDWRRLENWPVLGGESVRQNPRAFVANDCSTRRMFHEHTSGTSGKPLDLWWSHGRPCDPGTR